LACGIENVGDLDEAVADEPVDAGGDGTAARAD
jgi:hypothetical protein